MVNSAPDARLRCLKNICSQAGIQGYKTNHSIRTTAATRLYQAGVDKQVVMERTGHRSLEGVRSYKRTCDDQRGALSDRLNRKRPRQDNRQGVEQDKHCTLNTVGDSQNALDLQYSTQCAFSFNSTSCGSNFKLICS